MLKRGYLERDGEHVRQGDVLVIRRDKKPGPKHKPVPREHGRVILAHGELTGHAHAIDDEVAKLYQAGNGRLLVVESNTTNLTHEEHGPHPLPPGTYEPRRQRQYAPESVTGRFVDD